MYASITIFLIALFVFIGFFLSSLLTFYLQGSNMTCKIRIIEPIQTHVFSFKKIYIFPEDVKGNIYINLCDNNTKY